MNQAPTNTNFRLIVLINFCYNIFMLTRELNSKLQKATDHFKETLNEIRTGRATSSLVDNLRVEAYPGSFLTLKELASINVPDASSIFITPWDKTTVAPIEKALRQVQGASFNPVVDDTSIKLPIPPLSEERRHEMAKLVKVRLEESKVAIRNVRQTEMKSLDEQEQEGVISKEEKFRVREEVETTVKEYVEVLEDLASKKEQELLRV